LWVRPAKQERSQWTHEHFLDTLEAMLEVQGIHTVQVKALAQQAELSVGGFYSRFVNKDGVVRALCKRFAIEAAATAELALEPARWLQTSLPDAISPPSSDRSAQSSRRRPPPTSTSAPSWCIGCCFRPSTTTRSPRRRRGAAWVTTRWCSA
jgi:AcrR family transcriptional regulator